MGQVVYYSLAEWISTWVLFEIGDRFAFVVLPGRGIDADVVEVIDCEVPREDQGEIKADYGDT